MLATLGKVTAGVAAGELNPKEASTVADLLKRRAIETVQVEQRLAELEARQSQ